MKIYRAHVYVKQLLSDGSFLPLLLPESIFEGFPSRSEIKQAKLYCATNLLEKTASAINVRVVWRTLMVMSDCGNLSIVFFLYIFYCILWNKIFYSKIIGVI